jgi:hypothetical protein
MGGQHTYIKWAFKSYIRARAFGWRGSRLAVQRLKEAVSEISSNSRRAPIDAADGAVCLMERLWPAFELIDTSSGALGGAVAHAVGELIPLIVRTAVDDRKRNRWLERLWRAIQLDGISYLSLVEESWGDLCGNADVASHWADKILPALRAAWNDWRPGAYVKGTDICLSSLLTAGRYQELLGVLALKQHPVWPWRRYGIRALLAQGLFQEALAYSESSRGLNIPDSAVDAECEAILLAAGRREEAYRQFSLTANQANVGLTTFQRITRKYPEIDPRSVLADLADRSGDPGRWFAAAKTDGYLDLALKFAEIGRTEPRTLSRASRDFLNSEPLFAFRVGRLAVERILASDGYEITALDLLGACDHFLAAASHLGVTAAAKQELAQIVAGHPDAPSLFRGVVSIRLDDAVASSPTPGIGE